MVIKSRLDEIGLTPDNSIVIGSGILNALGIRENKDIDVVVNEASYLSLHHDSRFKKEINHDRELLTDALFEIGKDWNVLGKVWRLDDLKSNSIIIDSVRYITLDFLLGVKRSWLLEKVVRPKDAEDVSLIENYFQNIQQ